MPEFFVVFAWVATIIGSVLLTILLLYSIMFVAIIISVYFDPNSNFDWKRNKKHEPMDVSGGKGNYILSDGREISILLDKYGRPSQPDNYNNKPPKPNTKLYKNIEQTG